MVEQDVIDNFLKGELERCKSSPYYFYTHYIKINGKKATTNLSEKEFNERFKKITSITK